jgi:ribonuclease T2
MRLFGRALAVAALSAGPAGADRAGDFDYWVLALSWSPSWCAADGDRSDAEQCDPGADRRFIVHGLWPQRERGWPEFCETDARDPSRRETRAMADLMGSGGLAFAQWRKHGRCSGLDPADYFALTREAAARVRAPLLFSRIDKDAEGSPRAVERQFLDANPGLTAPGVTVTCRDGALAEVRICFDRSLRFRACAPDAARDCRAASLEIPAPP